jgi:hypothetical protein
MEPKDDFENIKLPYVRNVKPTLVWDEIGITNLNEIGKEESKRIVYIIKKAIDDIHRYEFGGNKKIHNGT